MAQKIIPVILAGGSGTRLWPLSRKNYPKQFLKLTSDHSLLQETILRTQTAINPDNYLIVSNEAHYFICQDQLNEIDIDQASYLLEPCARNTAPAIALAAHHIKQTIGDDTIMLVLPADHLMAEHNVFSEALSSAIEAAKNDFLVTFGIKPTAPKTGYGYIESGNPLPHAGFQVTRFTEKPDEKTAKSFLKKGNFFWNSGMFVFKPSAYLYELKQHAPEIHQAALAAHQASKSTQHYCRIDHDAFTACPNDSIDYAVMEKTKKAAIVPLDLSWSDLGCWDTVAQAGLPDENNNFVRGNVIIKNSSNCLVSSEGRLVATLGIDDKIVVSTPDAVLVADKSYSQQVKDIVNSLNPTNSQLAIEHKKVFRPWGFYESLATGEHYQVKHLMVKPGAALSLQLHHHRAEHWVVVSGKASIVNGDKTLTLNANESTYIPKETKHRLSNQETEPLHVIEVQSGNYLGEDDIVRFDDVYERPDNSEKILKT